MTYKCVYCLQSITSASPGRKASAQVRNAAKSHRNLIDDPVETHVHDNCRRFPDKYATFGQHSLHSHSARAHKRRINAIVHELEATAKKENQNSDELIQEIITSKIGKSIFPDTNNKLQLGNKYRKLLSNTADLITSLGPYNQHKQVLLHYLCKDLPLADMAAELNVSCSSIYSSQSDNYKPNTPLNVKYPINTTRERIATNERRAIQEVIKHFCPVKSGSEHKLLNANGDDKLKLEQELKDIKEHKELDKEQRKYQQQQKKELKADECIITQDFTILNLHPNSKQASEIRPITCMVVVFENNRDPPHYYDFICNDPITKKNDYYFVRQSWDIMLNQLKIFDKYNQALSIWSDGATKHFKQKYLWKYLAEIKEDHNKNRMEYNFFAPYHGHNRCDSQKPRINREINNSLQQAQINRSIKTVDTKDAEYWGPTTVEELSELINNMNNTTCTVIGSVDRANQLKPNLSALTDGSKQFFHVNFVDRNTIRTKKRSSDHDSMAVEQKFNMKAKRIKRQNGISTINTINNNEPIAEAEAGEVEVVNRELRSRKKRNYNENDDNNELLMDILSQMP